MAVLAGIDEAGYGPILGPLVVSSTAFSMPDSLLKADLWRVLKKSIGPTRRHLAGRLLVADSKIAYTKTIGIKHLQRTTLAMLGCMGESPSELKKLFSLLCPDCLERLKAYPWYGQCDGLSLGIDSADIRIASQVLADDMGNRGVKLLDIRSNCLDVAHYNKLVNAVNNKSSVLFSTTAVLIKFIWDNYRDDNIQIVVDRQGGKSHYRRDLQRMFPGLELAIIKESSGVSSYELKNSKRRMRIHFTVKADQNYLPVSLASMVSKYLRELLVERINHYFLDHHKELRPTAGYYKDGRRFIADLKTHIPHVKYDENQLIRCR
jgi:ribonuclease HII